MSAIMLQMLAAMGAADTTAPTITSANTDSVAENVVLSHALTADESVTWSIVGGADQTKFEISGSTLRWASNGTKDFEIPDDADTNNTYIVTVRATDLSSNTTDQTITVTVTDATDWVTTFTATTFNTDEGGWTGYNIRLPFPAAQLSTSGTLVRITIVGGSAEGIILGACYIGEKAAAGDAYDFQTTPTQITFNSGSSSVTTGAGGTVVSDAITFTLDETKDYIIAVHCPSGNAATDTMRGVNSGNAHYYKNAANECATANVTGYSTVAAQTRLVSKIEVA